MRIGSLCTGIAGLELGLQYAGIETKPVFVSDIDPGACDWLDQAMPYTSNLGDFTQLDELPEVDIITAGFPCQPVSQAGLRQGIHDDRWLFDDICRLVSRMDSRPVLFLENVSGILTANSGEAMGRVVHGLADIGYYITWGTLPAAAVGAPHQRNRWWGLAWHPENVDQKRSVLKSSSQRRASAPVRSTGSDAYAADANSARCERRPVSVTGTPEDHRPGSTKATAAKREQRLEQFGQYARAIERWECVLGRTAPDPTVDGRLNPSFCEWMMGYPEGWVTDMLTNRRHALHALGNAVVPQCAAEAFLQLSTR